MTSFLSGLRPLFPLLFVAFFATNAPAAGDAAKAVDAYAAFKQIVYQEPPASIANDEEKAAAWYRAYFVQAGDAALNFFTEHPQDPRRWEAANLYSLYAHNLRDPVRMEKGRALSAEALAAKDISERDWTTAKQRQISDRMAPLWAASRKGEKIDLAEARQGLDELAARYPQSSALGALEFRYVTLLKTQDPKAALAQLEKLTRSGNAEVAKISAGQLRIMRMSEHPAEMSFTALDGREVDLKHLRGRVVLIDFWATWCGPCVAEIPNIKKVYEAYHDRGFEVIGITLDQPSDETKVRAFLKERNLPWPQFLDRENRTNRFATEYGIIAIPTPLLLDQEGRLVSDQARGPKLESEVKRLLKL